MTFVAHLRRDWDRDDAIMSARMQDYFLNNWGGTTDDYVRRLTEIRALPQVEWKGRKLRTIRCQGEFGKGPHDVNVPESLLWTLRHFEAFRCPYHA